MSSAMYPNVGSSIDAVFEGVDAGHFTMPERLVSARNGLEALRRQLRELSGPISTTTNLRESHAAELVSIASGEAGALDGSALRTAVKSAQTLKEDRQLVTRAIGKIDISDVIIGVADELVTDHLRPALAETLADVAPLLPALEGRALDTTGMAAAPKATREAYLAVLPLLSRHQAVRRAQKALRAGYYRVASRREGHRHGPEDVYDYFLDTRAWPALRTPGVYIVSPAGTIDPGPMDPLARLLWLAKPESLAWLPTPAEQDGAWQALLAVMADPNHHLRPGRYAAAAAAIGS